jgi:hypothetical protein
MMQSQGRAASDYLSCACGFGGHSSEIPDYRALHFVRPDINPVVEPTSNPAWVLMAPF